MCDFSVLIIFFVTSSICYMYSLIFSDRFFYKFLVVKLSFIYLEIFSHLVVFRLLSHFLCIVFSLQHSLGIE